MTPRWAVRHRVGQHTLGETEGIPLHVQVSDSLHPWFRVYLRILWMRFGDFVLLRLSDLRVHPHRLDHAIPSDVIENDLWWCAVMDEAHDHLLQHAAEFDPGTPPLEGISTGWESGPYDPADPSPDPGSADS